MICAHLPDKGWKEPSCVDLCPTEALKFSKEKPRGYYLGLAKRFGVGAVYDLEEGKCIEGAKVTLIDTEASEKITVKTNDFRDFWLKESRVGMFSLLIKEVGYYPQEIKSISTGRNVNVGDIKLYKKA